MWHQWLNLNFTKLQENFLCAKKTETTLFNNSSLLCHSLLCIHESMTTHACVAADTGASVLTQNTHTLQLVVQAEECTRIHHDTVVNAHQRLTEEKKNCWIKSLFLFSLSLNTKKYLQSFKTLRLNHWCHMDYFNNVLTTFLGLECVSCSWMCLCRIRNLLDFIKNILICVLKMNEGLTGLERHEGE